mgnify:CR=1 FL=1
MKRPVFSFRPNRKDRNHRKAWSILEKSQFVVDAILFYDQADALEQLIRKSVREELKCGDVRQTAATAEPEELPDQVLDFISMLQEE